MLTRPTKTLTLWVCPNAEPIWARLHRGERSGQSRDWTRRRAMMWREGHYLRGNKRGDKVRPSDMESTAQCSRLVEGAGPKHKKTRKSAPQNGSAATRGSSCGSGTQQGCSRSGQTPDPDKARPDCCPPAWRTNSKRSMLIHHEQPRTTIARCLRSIDHQLQSHAQKMWQGRRASC